MSRPRPKTRTAARAFSLPELVIVAVLVTVIAFIAAPRVSRAAQTARASALVADARTLQLAIEHYAAEHGGRTPDINPDGTQTLSPAVFAQRLIGRTDHMGTPSPTGLYGPYLRKIPKNRYGGTNLFRIGGAPAGGGGGTGWHFDPLKGTLAADDSAATAQLTMTTVGAAVVIGNDGQ